MDQSLHVTSYSYFFFNNSFVGNLLALCGLSLLLTACTMFSWWGTKNEVPVPEEVHPDIDLEALTRKLDRELKFRVKIADTPCDAEHGWKLESVVSEIKVYTSCKPTQREGWENSKLEYDLDRKNLEFENDGGSDEASAAPARADIPKAVAAASSECTASKSSPPPPSPASTSTGGTVDSPNAAAAGPKDGVAVADNGNTGQQMACCKTVGSIQGISAAEAVAAWWVDWGEQETTKVVPAVDLQYFSKYFRIRHQTIKPPFWGLSDRCCTWSNRIVHFDPEGDRHIVQILTESHKKRTEAQAKRLNQVVAGMDISCIFQTVFLNGKNKDSADLTRKDVRCTLVYQSEMDPGGYVPLWIVRAFSKRAFPKFIEIFINYCHKCYDDVPLRLSDVSPPMNGRPSTAAEYEAFYQSELKRIAEEDAAEASAVVKK